uniref:SPRY domain-containing protein n=1 Tax=Meloidogyne incognita TaxID=6306 RepID=A0A914KYQ2_MELIC
MSEESTNSDFDLVQNWINQNNNNYDFDVQSKVADLLIEFNEEKEKNAKLEGQMNEMSVSYEKKIGELTNKLERLSKNCKRARFVQIKNKWGEINDYCCFNKCLHEINTNNIKCIKGNGFVKLIDDENCKYINCLEGKGFNKYVEVYVENNFAKREEDCINYSLFYFEIKVKREGDNPAYNWITIGLENINKAVINLLPVYGIIENERCEVFKLEGFCWNDGDIFGCGLVYPPTDKLLKKLPYIFFTQNGNQIGKAVLLKDNYGTYMQVIWLRCCSVEANFGNDLETKPFCYDITKHFVIKEFYEDIDVD